jgi:hypothetical protein
VEVNRTGGQGSRTAVAPGDDDDDDDVFSFSHPAILLILMLTVVIFTADKAFSWLTQTTKQRAKLQEP